MNQEKVLIHFTDEPEKVRSILLSGFVYVARRTGTASFLLPSRIKLRDREPEQFGMISFRENAAGEYSEPTL